MKFKLGRVMQTAGIAAMISESKEFGQFVASALRRYAACDWGDMSKEDFECNDEALETGDRIFAAYVDKHDTKIWIITESDRSYTTVLLPDEY